MEGDTFVAETAGFKVAAGSTNQGHPHTDALRTTERFRRVDFGYMELKVDIDDPKAYPRPWTSDDDPLVLMPDTELLEHLCENNRDWPNLQRIWGERKAPQQIPGESMTRRVAMVLGLLVIAASGRAVAHHSFAAEFDENKPVKLTGTVTKLEWTNPHIWFFIDVKNPDGTVTNWGLEMASPNGLLRAGWKRDTMKIGDVVAVEARQARDGSNNANAQAVMLTATGQKLFAGSPIPAAQVTRTPVCQLSRVVADS